ncbi:MAG: phosphate--AMP phosphotransferase [Verrucomicrobiota bacterium]
MSDTTNAAKLNKSEQKEMLKSLAIRIGVLQRETKEKDIPTLVIIEGLDASLKGQLLNKLILEIDTRSYDVYSTHASHAEPRKYPLLWRFWNNTPSKGRIQFFDRAGYYLTLDAWAEGNLSEDELERYWEDQVEFEKQLSEDGVRIVKIFLTVSKKTQAERLEEMESNPKTAWRVTKKDWKRHDQYKAYRQKVERMVEKTNTEFARWKVIETDNFRSALIELYETLSEELQAALDYEASGRKPSKSTRWIPYDGPDYLSRVNLTPTLDRTYYKKLLKERQATIHDLVHEIHTHKIPVVLAYCGWDAAGKGGCIKRLVQGMDPRSYKVSPTAAPTSTELSHHYLWRFWKEMPAQGRITIFDRSWYGRVLVERIEGLCSNVEWKRAYEEMNQMEKHLTDFGTVVIKFWLHIDNDTQLERFIAREESPLKQWKITEEDWRNRKKWNKYEQAANEMIHNTDKPNAPWVVVSSVCKMHARIKTLDTVIEHLQAAIERNHKPVL